jgi:hypothetical protein
VLIGLQNDDGKTSHMILNPNGIRLQQETLEKQCIYVKQLFQRYFWVKKSDSKQLWKLFNNCELIVYLTDGPRISQYNYIYQVASGFPFKNFNGAKFEMAEPDI